MRTRISETPDSQAGSYISNLIKEHGHEKILLLLSGGSAFAVLDYIDTSLLGEHITIAMVDERYTFEEKGNNFTHLLKTAFYEKAIHAGVNFIESIPQKGESLQAFTIRVKDELEKCINENPNCYALGIFGIGEDGHTAGIFPAAETVFNALYKSGEYYVAFTHETAAYPFRTTVTPTFIEEVLDEVIMFAVGKNKCDNILDYMYNKNFHPHEIPALIPASHPQSILFTDCPTLIP